MIISFYYYGVIFPQICNLSTEHLDSKIRNRIIPPQIENTKTGSNSSLILNSKTSQLELKNKVAVKIDVYLSKYGPLVRFCKNLRILHTEK